MLFSIIYIRNILKYTPLPISGIRLPRFRLSSHENWIKCRWEMPVNIRLTYGVPHSIEFLLAFDKQSIASCQTFDGREKKRTGEERLGK